MDLSRLIIPSDREKLVQRPIVINKLTDINDKILFYNIDRKIDIVEKDTWNNLKMIRIKFCEDENY